MLVAYDSFCYGWIGFVLAVSFCILYIKSEVQIVCWKRCNVSLVFFCIFKFLNFDLFSPFPFASCISSEVQIVCWKSCKVTMFLSFNGFVSDTAM